MLEFGEAVSIIGFVVFVPSYYFAVQRIGVLSRIFDKTRSRHAGWSVQPKPLLLHP